MWLCIGRLYLFFRFIYRTFIQSSSAEENKIYTENFFLFVLFSTKPLLLLHFSFHSDHMYFTILLFFLFVHDNFQFFLCFSRILLVFVAFTCVCSAFNSNSVSQFTYNNINSMYTLCVYMVLCDKFFSSFLNVFIVHLRCTSYTSIQIKYTRDRMREREKKRRRSPVATAKVIKMRSLFMLDTVLHV